MTPLNKETILKKINETNAVLKPTQNKLCIPILNRIYKKMKFGIKFDDIKVCDSLIIDGHHRYICSLLANINIDITKSSKTSATTVYVETD